MEQMQHTVTAYEEELKDLATKITEMGGIVEHMVAGASSSLLNGDSKQAREIIKMDKSVDDLHHKIDDLAVSVIARRQPMAKDLRAIISAMRIASDIERIGDLAKNIARRTLAIEMASVPKYLGSGIEHMTRLCLEQVKMALNAFSEEDKEQSISLAHKDDEIDILYTSIFRSHLTYMMENPKNITLSAHVLFCAKNLERIGDHAVNIAESVYFLETGAYKDLESININDDDL